MKRKACFLLWCASVLAAPVNQRLLSANWPAQWIAAPGAPPFDYGVYHFRRSFDLAERPAQFVVHISADNRYRLFVNGQFAAAGPAQSDLRNWRFETVNLSPLLKPGRNVIAAIVWNGGPGRPMAQISHRTGFILQGDGDAEKIVNTGKQWKTALNPAYSPLTWRDNDARLGYQYYVAGAMEKLDASRYPWGWEQPDFDDSPWAAAEPLDPGAPSGVESHQKWQLTPSPVPLLKESPRRFARGVSALTVPAKTRTTVLLDQGMLTTGYPILVTSGGRGGLVRLVYSEALYSEKNVKGNRGETTGKRVVGVWDEFLPDGGIRRVYKPLWVRTWRFIEMQVETGEEPLVIEDARSDECAFPAERAARFASDRPMLTRIWDTGWRTLHLAAQDVFVSDLYWERIQYVGDTKLQALAWLAATGEESLYRQALEQFDASRAPFGLTQSRYPADLEQYTPLYSLVWVTMVHDFWRYRGDDEFLRRFLPGIGQVLAWFERQKTSDGLIPPLFQLDFVDSNYRHERAIREKEGRPGMTIHSLFYVMALDQAADLFAHFGREWESKRYRQESAAVRAAVQRLCWDEQRQLFSDTPSKVFFSQQANILAVLSGAASSPSQLLDRVLSDKSLLPVQLYFRFYLGRALKLTGRGDAYVDNLGPWEAMVSNGMTTFGETDNNPRSECHPWSATPVYELLSTVAGIEPAEPGFRTVRIAPALGSLQRVEAAMPHPLGLIEVSLQRQGANGLKAKVRLPAGLKGTFVWAGQTVPIDGTKELSF